MTIEADPVWRRLYQGWLLIAGLFGEVQTLIVVALIYALVIGPVAAAIAIGRGDLLQKRKLYEPGSAWHDADTTTAPDLDRAKRLF